MSILEWKILRILYIGKQKLKHLKKTNLKEKQKQFSNFYRLREQKPGFSFLVASTPTCFMCSAYNGELCELDHQTKQCDNPNEICLTTSYKDYFNGKLRNNFIKRCTNGWDGCQANCIKDGTELIDCKVSVVPGVLS